MPCPATPTGSSIATRPTNQTNGSRPQRLGRLARNPTSHGKPPQSVTDQGHAAPDSDRPPALGDTGLYPVREGESWPAAPGSSRPFNSSEPVTPIAVIGRQCRHTTSNATGRRASSQLGASIKSFSICRRAQPKFGAHRVDHLNGPRAQPTQLKWLPQQVSLMLSRDCTETPISVPFRWPWANQHYDGDGSIAPDF